MMELLQLGMNYAAFQAQKSWRLPKSLPPKPRKLHGQIILKIRVSCLLSSTPPSRSAALHRRVEWQPETAGPLPQRAGTHSSILILKQQPTPRLSLLFTPHSLLLSLDNVPSLSYMIGSPSTHSLFLSAARVSAASFTSVPLVGSFPLFIRADASSVPFPPSFSSFNAAALLFCPLTCYLHLLVCAKIVLLHLFYSYNSGHISAQNLNTFERNWIMLTEESHPLTHFLKPFMLFFRNSITENDCFAVVNFYNESFTVMKVLMENNEIKSEKNVLSC